MDANSRSSDRITRLGASTTSSAAALARALAAEGRKIVSLTTGEPDTPTPSHVQEAALAAIRAGQTRYTDTGGTAALKAAIHEKFWRDNGLDYAGDEVIAANGGKQIIFNAISVSVDHGDEVIIVAPYWVSYPEIVHYAGGRPVIVKTDEASGFKITPKMLASAITPRTRWFILNSPSNPSGALYSRKELESLAEVLRGAPHVWILSDDIYEHIRYDGAEFFSIAQIAPDLKGRVLTVNGVSKAYSMTGWRIGFAGGPRDLISQMGKLQSQSTSSPNAIAQAAAVAALNGPMDEVVANTLALERRRDRVLERLRSLPCLGVSKPAGAFYFYISVAKLIGCRTRKGAFLETDGDVARFLLEDHGLAVVAGTGFGLSPYIRISYAASDERMDAALSTLSAACAEATGERVW